MFASFWHVGAPVVLRCAPWQAMLGREVVRLAHNHSTAPSTAACHVSSPGRALVGSWVADAHGLAWYPLRRSFFG